MIITQSNTVILVVIVVPRRKVVNCFDASSTFIFACTGSNSLPGSFGDASNTVLLSLVVGINF